MPLEKQACGRFFMEKDAEKPLPKEEERVYKKEGYLSQTPNLY